jgi:PAS domain S-box-containing protein
MLNEDLSSKISILVVEDSPTQAEQIRYELEKKSYIVTLAYNGEEAFEWLLSTSKTPDVIVSDVMMPRMDGYELCRAIRKDERFSKIPIVLLTSLSEPEDIIKSIEAGANKFLTKPLNSKRLADVINELYINTQRRSVERMEMGIRLVFGGKDFLITAEKVQILDLLISSYEESYYQNIALKQARSELEAINAELEARVQERTKELQVSAEKYRTLSENTPDLIIRFDLNAKIIYVNMAYEKVFGIDASTLINQSAQKLEELSNSCEYVKNLQKVIESQRPLREECKTLYKEKEIYMDATFVPEFDYKNVLQSVLVVSRDVTQNRLLEKSLHEKERLMLMQSKHAAMGEMIGMIAHQWRQPLTVISMEANNIIADIELDLVSNEANEKHAKDILKQTNYLSQTIEDFRSYFKPSHEQEFCSVSDIMHESLEIIGKSLEDSMVEMQINFEETPKILTYSNELMQVFINLLKNSQEALIANQENKRFIKVRIFEKESSVAVEVCDNGGGISDDIIDRVFEPYFTTKDESVGTGLGLYMSKTIIEKHLKGEILVKNREDGVCFYISLPKDFSKMKRYE